jgi:hypothetical protein
MHQAIRKRLYRFGQVPLFAIAVALSASALPSSSWAKAPASDFSSGKPFSRTMQGGGDTVCWNVKRAFFDQGYMLDRSSDSAVMTGTKDTQKDDKTSVTVRLQATCVDNKDGTSTVFASAAREVSKLQKVRQGVSAGVAFATVTVPTGSENVMEVVSRETIQDPHFYDGFYKLVQGYVAEDQAHAGPRQTAARDTRDARNDEHEARNDAPPVRNDAREEARDNRDAGAPHDGGDGGNSSGTPAGGRTKSHPLTRDAGHAATSHRSRKEQHHGSNRPLHVPKILAGCRSGSGLHTCRAGRLRAIRAI